jgi:hypothetical protein
MNLHPSHPEYGAVPVSKGIHPRALFITVIGVVMVFAVGYTVLHFASYGHVWPAKTSQRIDLSAPSSQ